MTVYRQSRPLSIGTRCMTVNPCLLPLQENRRDRQPMAKRDSTEEKSSSLSFLPPPPAILFSTLFLLSFGNHIVWDYFLWEQEGAVEGKTKRLRALCMTVPYVFFHVCSQNDTLLHQRWNRKFIYSCAASTLMRFWTLVCLLFLS